MEGHTSGDIKGGRTFTPDSDGVAPIGEQGFEVQYVMSPNFSPLQVPQEIGTAKLNLIIEGAGQEKGVVSPDIPVLDNCSE